MTPERLAMRRSRIEAGRAYRMQLAKVAEFFDTQMVQKVRATYDLTKPCTVRCWQAQGDVCVCECAGQSHGKQPVASW